MSSSYRSRPPRDRLFLTARPPGAVFCHIAKEKKLCVHIGDGIVVWLWEFLAWLDVVALPGIPTRSDMVGATVR